MQPNQIPSVNRKPGGVFQIRPGTKDGNDTKVEGKWYDPSRDIAHNFHIMLHSAFQQMQLPTSPIAEWLLNEGFTQGPRTVEAAECITKFVVGVEDRDMMNLLRTSGVLNCRARDIQLIGGFVLMVMMAWYHRGWGAAHMTNEKPPEDMQVYQQEVMKIVSKWLMNGVSFWKNPILWIRLWWMGR